MGNSKSKNSNRNKDFQAVVPLPKNEAHIDNNVQTTDRPPTSEQSDSKRRRMNSDATNITSPNPTSPTSSQPQQGLDLQSAVTQANNNAEDYALTESQQRLGRMAESEYECSEILNYLFVGSHHVASDRDLLRRKGITHVINCSAAVVDCFFKEEGSLQYLSLSMVDGRQDDISWFLCEVIQFIHRARKSGGKVLLHCEKGISRSCSFAIAYRMWSAGEAWKTAFAYVKQRRRVCSPNTAFTCQLIEIDELINKDAVVSGNIVFRCSYHLPHDPKRAVLKLCRNTETRKILPASTSLLDPRGVFILRAVIDPADPKHSKEKTDSRRHQQQPKSRVIQHFLYLWQGKLASTETAMRAAKLAEKMFGVFTREDQVIWMKQGKEKRGFLECLIHDGPHPKQLEPGGGGPESFPRPEGTATELDAAAAAATIVTYEDYYDFPPPEEETNESRKQMEADHIARNGGRRAGPPIDPEDTKPKISLLALAVPSPAKSSKDKKHRQKSPADDLSQVETSDQLSPLAAAASVRKEKHLHLGDLSNVTQDNNAKAIKSKVPIIAPLALGSLNQPTGEFYAGNISDDDEDEGLGWNLLEPDSARTDDTGVSKVPPLRFDLTKLAANNTIHQNRAGDISGRTSGASAADGSDALSVSSGTPSRRGSDAGPLHSLASSRTPSVNLSLSRGRESLTDHDIDNSSQDAANQKHSPVNMLGSYRNSPSGGAYANGSARVTALNLPSMRDAVVSESDKGPHSARDAPKDELLPDLQYSASPGVPQVRHANKHRRRNSRHRRKDSRGETRAPAGTFHQPMKVPTDGNHEMEESYVLGSRMSSRAESATGSKHSSRHGSRVSSRVSSRASRPSVTPSDFGGKDSRNSGVGFISPENSVDSSVDMDHLRGDSGSLATPIPDRIDENESGSSKSGGIAIGSSSSEAFNQEETPEGGIELGSPMKISPAKQEKSSVMTGSLTTASTFTTAPVSATTFAGTDSVGNSYETVATKESEISQASFTSPHKNDQLTSHIPEPTDKKQEIELNGTDAVSKESGVPTLSLPGSSLNAAESNNSTKQQNPAPINLSPSKLKTLSESSEHFGSPFSGSSSGSDKSFSPKILGQKKISFQEEDIPSIKETARGVAESPELYESNLRTEESVDAMQTPPSTHLHLRPGSSSSKVSSRPGSSSGRNIPRPDSSSSKRSVIPTRPDSSSTKKRSAEEVHQQQKITSRPSSREIKLFNNKIAPMSSESGAEGSADSGDAAPPGMMKSPSGSIFALFTGSGSRPSSGSRRSVRPEPMIETPIRPTSRPGINSTSGSTRRPPVVGGGSRGGTPVHPLIQHANGSRSGTPVQQMHHLQLNGSRQGTPVQMQPVQIAVKASGSDSRSRTNSQTNLDLRLLARTPSRGEERMPEDVTLSRGPTPIEDLTPGRLRLLKQHGAPGSTSTSEKASDHSPLNSALNTCRSKNSAEGAAGGVGTASNSARGVASNSGSSNHGGSTARSHRTNDSGGDAEAASPLADKLPSKPMLYQCAPKDTKKKGSPSKFEWQAMGVYDDDDLDEGGFMLLICPSGHHFVWFGPDFDFTQFGISDNKMESNGFPSFNKIHKMAAKVSVGEVEFNAAVGDRLLKAKVSVEIGGDESDEFWIAFNEGY